MTKYSHHCLEVLTPSAPIQERERDEISETRARYNRQEDPGVVRHDTQHHHVAHSHLQNVEERLVDMKHPPERQRDEDFQFTWIWTC